jgi:HipA-like protein
MPKLKDMVAILRSWGLGGPSEDQEDHAKKRAPRELRLHLPTDDERVWVGSLSQERGQYVFRYSPDFKERSDLPALLAFPDKRKVYRAERLWPFFQARLPSTTRPDVERLMRERDIDPANTFLLLGELGKRTITTPYEFELAPSHSG